jgi:ubiquitin-protein ligase
MIDPRARRRRLVNDYQDMLRIRGSVISFEAFNPPAPERYVIDFRLRSIMSLRGGQPVYSPQGHSHRIQLELPSRYPAVLTNESVQFLTAPIFHPNIFTSGKVCIGGFRPSESLARFILRLAKMIQFDPAYINEDSPANVDAKNWYVHNRRLFPVDRSKLPDPDHSDQSHPTPKRLVLGTIR